MPASSSAKLSLRLLFSAEGCRLIVRARLRKDDVGDATRGSSGRAVSDVDLEGEPCVAVTVLIAVVGSETFGPEGKREVARTVDDDETLFCL
jgi:hypothetical protein